MSPIETAFDRQRAGPTTSTSTIPSPGSPTFTNPDMILPYESERESSTPSPPFKALHLQHVHPQSLPYSPQNHSTTGTSNGFAGMALPAKHSSVKPARYRSNTWEGENDEARSIASTGSEAQANSGWGEPHHFKGGDPRNNTAWPTDDNEERDAEGSSLSSSTISASSGIPKQSPPKNSRFRRYASEEGDYRNASRESDHGAEEEQYGAEVERRKMGAIAEEEDEEKEDSDREMLSSEAERILENAKKRLTSMEGNLNRARTSFRMTPSPAPQLQHHSFGIQGIHNGPLKSGVRPERRAQTSLAGALLRQRASQDPGSLKSYHSRGLSDIYVSPSLKNDPTARTKHSFRSISALGSTNASGYGSSDFSLANSRHRHKRSTGSTGSNGSNVFNNPAHTSEPEPEPEPEPEREQSSHTDPQSGGSSAVPHPEHKQLPYQHKSQGSIDSSSSEYSQRESQSEAPVLKGTSREDSKVRTPSPSTNAEQWYTGTTEYPTRTAPRSRAGSDQQNSSRGFETPAEGTFHINPSSTQETQNYYNTNNNQSIADLEDVDEHPDKSLSSTAEIDREALAEILNEPFDEGEELLEQDIMEGFPPVPPIAETMRHEDRLDAFDYEHFILHSALGNYSNIRTRPQSYSSAESTETTRPPNDFETNGLPVNEGHHGRKNSADSISTSATFATATEGAGYTEDEDDGDYWSGNEDLSQMRRKDRDMAHQMTTREAVASGDIESPDSPTYPGLVSRSANSTPRAFESTYPISNNEDSRDDSNLSDGSSTPVRSIPPESFVEYIISSAVAEESRIHSSVSNKLDSDDIELLKTVVQGISYSGEKLIRASMSDPPSSIDGEPISLLRRRLDTARRALEGGFDV